MFDDDAKKPELKLVLSTLFLRGDPSTKHCAWHDGCDVTGVIRALGFFLSFRGFGYKDALQLFRKSIIISNLHTNLV